MILAIDQGTTGTHLPRLRRRGPDRAAAPTRSSSSTSRGPGWVEHDATEIWEVTRRVAAEAIADAGIEGARAGRDRDHQPARDRRRLGPGDRRAGPPGARLAGPPHRRALRRAARGRARGAGPRAHRPRHRPLLLRRPRSSGCCATSRAPSGPSSARSTPGSLFKLTGRHVTDYSNASRTMLFDIRRLAWDEELCGLLGVDPARLPEPLPSAAGLRHDHRVRRRGPGRRDRRRPAGGALRPGLPRARGWRRTPTAPAASSSSTPAPRRREPAEGLLTTVAWGLGEEAAYALEASIFVTGAAVQWLRDGLGIIDEAARDRGAGRLARRQRRRLLRPGADRARLAALGPLRARDDRRPHPRQRPRPPGAGGAGGDRLPDGRRGPGAGGGRGRAARAC